MAETIKLGEISKRLKITNKDIIAKLAEYGVELKSAASVVDEETIGLILDIYTQANEVSEEEILEMRTDAVKKQSKASEKKEEVKQEEKTKEVKAEAEKAEKKETKAEKAEKKDAKTEKTEKKEEKPAPKTEEKPKNEKHKKVAKKQSGQKIDLSNVDRSNVEEEYVVKTEERKRHVDTRQSTVELDAIDSRERIEDMVPDNIKMDKKGGKVKNKKGGKTAAKRKRTSRSRRRKSRQRL